MPSEIYEIVELANGDVALRRAGDDEKSLVCIQFSDESLEFIRGHKVVIARAMLEAGIEAVQDLGEQAAEFEHAEEETSVLIEHTIH